MAEITKLKERIDTMDFYTVRNNITQEDCEDIYKGIEADEYEFEKDLILAIQDECGFNVNQAKSIYNSAYSRGHSSGFDSIVSCAVGYSYLCRSVINLGD